MDIEFHYHMTNIIAQRAQFSHDQAFIIAYASQFVDDNDDEYIVNKGEDDEYRNTITQTMNILRPKPELMQIYPCFHFIPGKHDQVSARRKDGKMHLLNTTPNSRRARQLLREALASDDLYRIGVATHAYADTWAHQNFVGYYDYFNAMRGTVDRLSPNIGHADAAHDPDIPGLVWRDGRLITRSSAISNKERFLDAAKHIFHSYRKHLSRTVTKGETDREWETLRNDLDNAMGVVFENRDRGKSRKQRLNRYKKLIEDFREYDEEEWFSAAVKRHLRGVPDKWHDNLLNGTRIFQDKYTKKDAFDTSQWLKFQVAARAHQSRAIELNADIYDQMEITELAVGDAG